jgi:hypothetical protein
MSEMAAVALAHSNFNQTRLFKLAMNASTITNASHTTERGHMPASRASAPCWQSPPPPRAKSASDLGHPSIQSAAIHTHLHDPATVRSQPGPTRSSDPRAPGTRRHGEPDAARTNSRETVRKVGVTAWRHVPPRSVAGRISQIACGSIARHQLLINPCGLNRISGYRHRLHRSVVRSSYCDLGIIAIDLGDKFGGMPFERIIC